MIFFNFLFFPFQNRKLLSKFLQLLMKFLLFLCKSFLHDLLFYLFGNLICCQCFSCGYRFLSLLSFFWSDGSFGFITISIIKVIHFYFRNTLLLFNIVLFLIIELYFVCIFGDVETWYILLFLGIIGDKIYFFSFILLIWVWIFSFVFLATNRSFVAVVIFLYGRWLTIFQWICQRFKTIVCHKVWLIFILLFLLN